MTHACSAPRAPRAPRGRRDGFTLVEVTVSLGIMMIGAMALFGMQQQATRANVHARQMTVATQIAQTWVERFKLDATQWVAMTGNPQQDLTATEFLRCVAQSCAGASGGTEATFVTIPIDNTITPGISNGFDFFGRDIPSLSANLAQLRYCASYRMTWVYWDRDGFQTSTVPTDDRALRVDVRVWWPKERIVDGTKTTGNDMATDFGACVESTKLDPGGTEFNNYHVVYLSTVVRPT